MATLQELHSFLSKYVEGYLLEDLETLKTAVPRGGQDAGAASYPLLMTVFAGIELLGTLVSESRLDVNAPGAPRFQEFWRNHVYPNDALRQAAGSALYGMARHGLAHAFAVKGPLEVVKAKPEMHLVRTATGAISVDAVQLAIDFRAAYDALKPRITAGSALASTMTARLGEVDGEYRRQGSILLARIDLPAAPIHASLNTLTTSPGATGPAFP